MPIFIPHVTPAIPELPTSEVTDSPTSTLSSNSSVSVTDSESQTNPSEGKIAGISVAVLAFIVIVVVLLLLVYGMIVRRRKQKREHVSPSSENNDLLTEYHLGEFTEERNLADSYAEPFDSRKYKGEDAKVSAKNHYSVRFKEGKVSCMLALSICMKCCPLNYLSFHSILKTVSTLLLALLQMR